MSASAPEFNQPTNQPYILVNNANVGQIELRHAQIVQTVFQVRKVTQILIGVNVCQVTQIVKV